MKRVLVTGGTGFLGRHVIPHLLAEGCEVHATTRQARGGAEGAIWHTADLLDRYARQRVIQEAAPEAILHLAWYAVPGKFWSAEENIHWLEASADLIACFAKAGGRRAVIAGTCAEYDWSALTTICVEESTPLQPRTLYGACKHALHVVARALADDVGMSLAWARLFYLYGPHEPEGRLIGSAIRSLLAGRPLACSSGLQMRDLLYVDDAAAAMSGLFLGEETGAFNVASGRAVQLRGLLERVARIIGRPELLEFGALPNHSEPAVIVGSAQRLRERTGWRPKFDLNSGIDCSIAWWSKRIAVAEIGK